MKKIYITPKLEFSTFELNDFICGSTGGGSTSNSTERFSDLGDGTKNYIFNGESFDNYNNGGRGLSETGNRSKDFTWDLWED